MDGQRRIARPMMKRTPHGRWAARANHLGTRILARTGAVVILLFSIVSGASQGGNLDYDGSPFTNVSGKFASFFGLAADNINISGLSHHDPKLILAQIGVRPGGSLVGFDSEEARILIESLDWVASATVSRSFPNQLDIALTEREPIAVWQIDGTYQVIDREGAVMSGLDPTAFRHLPLVSGRGANLAAAEYINQLEALPELMLNVQAAARVGERRWTLFLDNGVKIALPEHEVDAALKRVAELDATQNILSKGIREIDLRTPDRIVVALAEAVGPDGEGNAAKVELSQSR